MSISEFIQFFLSICGGVSIVGGAAAVIFKWIAPAFRLNKRVEILEDHAEEGLILPVVVFSDIHAVQGDVAFRRVIQAAQELDEGGLSCAVQAHHCHFVLQGQFAGQILQHWLCAPGVCKAHVVEFNLVHMILPLFRGNGAGVGAFQGQEV